MSIFGSRSVYLRINKLIINFIFNFNFYLFIYIYFFKNVVFLFNSMLNGSKNDFLITFGIIGFFANIWIRFVSISARVLGFEKDVENKDL